MAGKEQEARMTGLHHGNIRLCLSFELDTHTYCCGSQVHLEIPFASVGSPQWPNSRVVTELQ